jgi:hypothetical protein
MSKILRLDSDGQEIYSDPIVQSSGNADAGEVVGLGSDGKLHSSVMPDGIGARVRSLPASGAISANDLVNIFKDTEDETPKWKARRASAASSATACNGFAKVGGNDGEIITVYLDGTFEVDAAIVSTLSNDRLYLSATSPGKPGPYSSAAAVVQTVGYLVDDTTAEFEPSTPVLQS